MIRLGGPRCICRIAEALVRGGSGRLDQHDEVVGGRVFGRGRPVRSRALSVSRASLSPISSSPPPPPPKSCGDLARADGLGRGGCLASLMSPKGRILPPALARVSGIAQQPERERSRVVRRRKDSGHDECAQDDRATGVLGQGQEGTGGRDGEGDLAVVGSYDPESGRR